MTTISSAQVVAEFIRGRASLAAVVTRIANDGFKAPEAIPALIQELSVVAMQSVSEEERAALDRVRGNGPVLWDEVAAAFKEPQ